MTSNLLFVYRAASVEKTYHVREPLGRLAEKWTELEWQALWYSGAFGTTFRSTDGALVEIIQFGFWNRESGPDFVHAAIRIDGNRTLEGDVEWDMQVADWERHGHSQNLAFDKVVLHVFLYGGGASHLRVRRRIAKLSRFISRKKSNFPMPTHRLLIREDAVLLCVNFRLPRSIRSLKRLRRSGCRRKRNNSDAGLSSMEWTKHSSRRLPSHLAIN